MPKEQTLQQVSKQIKLLRDGKNLGDFKSSCVTWYSECSKYSSCSLVSAPTLKTLANGTSFSSLVTAAGIIKS